jgi:hypothetical protein
MLNNNDDFNHYLTGPGFQTFNGEFTIADLTGPGAVYRFWHTDNTDTGVYHFYFDGETSASLTMSRPQFWRAASSPFVPPLSRNRNDSSGGNVTYVPIPYAKSLRITESFAGGGDYYNVGYITYEAGTQIASFSASQNTSVQQALFSNAGQNPHPADATEQTLTKTINLVPNASADIASLNGSRLITELRLDVPGFGAGLTPLQLDAYRIQMSWDGEASPSVDVPLAQFFAMNTSWDRDIKAIPLGKTQGSFYCYFPMPFAKSATIRLVGGASAAAANGVSVSVKHRTLNDSIDAVGTFHAAYRSASDSSTQYTFLDTTGSGHLVGVAISFPSKGAVLEGNENIYVDGLRFPSIFGTGTEDFFNAGWYFEHNTFSLPLHGASLSNDGNGPLTAYRFFLGDAVPFSSSLLARIQHVPGTPISSVAYYYQNTTKWSAQTDSIQFSDTASVSAHQYAMTAATALHVTDKFLLNDAPQTFDGFAGHAGSVVSFKAAIDPGNDGIALRRVLRAAGDQAAEVTIDGVPVGTWHTVETVLDSQAQDPAAAHLYERELWIPAAFTKGKSSVNVKLSVTSADWNDLAYSVRSRIPSR